MGYDPARQWQAGERPVDVFTLGDFQSLELQNLNLDQLAQLSGLDLDALRIADIPFLQNKSFAEIVDLVPALKDFTLEEIPALVEVLDFDLTQTLGDLIDADALLGDLNFTDLVGDFSVLDIPNLDLAELSSFAGWQATALSQIPGLGDIDFGTLSQLPDVFSGVTATHDISFGPKEHTKTPTKNAITGSDVDGFSVQCVQERGCANIELTGSGNMRGARWIAGGKGDGQQMVSGGQGVLGVINGGEEPTGRLPFGDTFKVVLDSTSETKGTAEFALYFRYCYRGVPDLGCTPYFLGPIPMPILNSKEGGMVITGFLDGAGGVTSGISAPKAWEDLRPANNQEIKDLLGEYGVSSRSGGRSLCGDGPAGINFYALAEAIHSIESSDEETEYDQYTIAGYLYVDGAKYGYPKESGYALGRYQYMTYRSDVAAIISAKPGGQAFIDRAFRGQRPTRAEIATYFTKDEQDRLFSEDQSKTIEWLLEQGYEGDRILEILGQMHFGGDVITNGSLDSKNASDGYGVYSLWEYGQIVRENYYKTLEESEQESKCKATGSFRNPTDRWPVNHRFDPTGRLIGRRHFGVDMGGDSGDPVFASDGGIVSIEDHGGDSWGLHIRVDHGDSVTLYGHLRSVNVSQGARVAKGDKIGEIGSTGRSSDPHLHFEVMIGGQHVDPDSVVDWNDFGQ